MPPGDKDGTEPGRLETRRVVRVVDLDPGDPPAVAPSIVVVERLRSLSRKERVFTQEIQVLDDLLFRRLQAEVAKGDEIEALVVTQFLEQGYTTYLAGYATRK